jgi:hypothetical protein
MKRNSIGTNENDARALMGPRRALSQQQPIIAPRYLRLPRPGERDPLCGLSRSELWNLIKNGSIKSVVLAQKGKTRGCRLINAQSLVEFIEQSAVV